MYPTSQQINQAIKKNQPFRPIALEGMTKKKIQLLVNKSLNLFVKQARSLRLGRKLWEFTWVSIATAKKRKFKKLHKLPHLEEYLENLLSKLSKVRPIKINYGHTCGASYKCLDVRYQNIDWIVVPSIRRFQRHHHYYKTIFHELFHCLQDRLTIADRLDNYEDEEITAEVCAMILCLLLGINSWHDSYKYIADYLLNSCGYLIHKGRVDYVKVCACRLLKYVLKLK